MLTENHNGVAFRASRIAALVVSLACAGVVSNTFAADSVWNGSAADGLFATPGNWAGGIVPGVADGTYTSTDVAIFSGGPPADPAANPLVITTVTTDTNRNVSGIRFENIDTVPFTIAGPMLHFTDGGLTEVLGSAVNNSPTSVGMTFTITAPMTVHGNAYTFRNDALPSVVGLRPQGDITFTGTGASVLTLDGQNAATLNNGPTQVWSVLSDAPGGTTSVVKNGTGTWELRPDGNNATARPNTYSGDTIINAGILRLSGQGAGSVNTTFIINAGARLQCSANNQVIGKVVLKSGGVFAASNATTFQSILSNSGPALLLDYDAAVVSPTISLGFAGTTAEQGGVKLDNHGQALLPVTLGNTTTPYNLGTVLRPFDIPAGEALNSYDFRLRGVISGTGGLLKLGNGKMRLEPSIAGTGSPLTGTIEVREGSLDFSASNGFVNKPELLISGGSVNIAGDQTQSLGAVSLTKGALTASNSGSLLVTPSVTFDVAASDSASVLVKISDDAAPTTVVKNGLGTATLGGSNSYTGGTTINAGTLVVDGDANDTIIGGPNVTTVGGVDIKGGRLAFDYTGGTSPAAQVLTDLQAGFAVNFSSGNLRSSTATSARGLGYADNGTDTFTVAAALYGDTDLNGTVDFDDLLKLAQNYGTASGIGWGEGDSTYDNAVTFDDLLKLAQNYGTSILADGTLAVDGQLAGAFDAHWALAQTLVPEPTTLGLLGGLALTSLRRRR